MPATEFAEKIKGLAARVEKQKSSIKTEEACKNAFVMPFLNALGYDVFNPDVVTPEFIADVGVKKGEKVDYAIKADGKIIMLVEVKTCGSDLANQHMSQLYRYFSVTDARFAILSNGLQYWFYSDLDEKNRMDQRPFFQFNILDYQPSHIAELRKFTRDHFDLDQILTTATGLKYSSAVQQEFLKEVDEPSEDFVRFFASRVYDGHLTKRVREDFKPIVSKALKETMRELINKRLTSALEATTDRSDTEEDTADASTAGAIVTTQEEIEAFHIVKSIAREIVKADRIVMRDAQSYCAILLDDNNRKTLVRLHLNRKKKYVGLFSNKREERVLIDSVDDIYQHAERIQATLRKYDNQARSDRTFTEATARPAPRPSAMFSGED